MGLTEVATLLGIASTVIAGLIAVFKFTAGVESLREAVDTMKAAMVTALAKLEKHEVNIATLNVRVEKLEDNDE